MIGRDLGSSKTSCLLIAENAAWLCTVESGPEREVGEKARESLELPRRECKVNRTGNRDIETTSI